jgi:hypothetical protein
LSNSGTLWKPERGDRNAERTADVRDVNMSAEQRQKAIADGERKIDQFLAA